MYTSTPPRRLSTMVLFAFVALSFFMYWNTRTAGFVTDWLGWEYRYRAGGWLDVFSSFGYKGVHPVLHFFNFALFKVFGTSSNAWFFVFAGVHALNAWLAGSLYMRVAPTRLLMHGAIGVGLLVLLSPYAAEPVVWRVCLHYLLSLCFALLALHALLDWLTDRNTKALVQVHLLFALGLLCLEWSMVVPGLCGLFLAWHQVHSKRFWLQDWLLVSGIQATMIGAWFGLNKLVLGQLVGHYGAKTHLTFEPLAVLANCWKYAAKNLFFMRYWHHPIKERVFAAFDFPAVAIGLTLAFLALLVYGTMRFMRQKQRTVLDYSLSMACFFVALLPVSNLFFYFIDYNENDRYGYFALPFFWIAMMILVTQLPKYLGRFLVGAALFTSVFCLSKTTRLWHEADQQYRSLIHDFHYYESESALLLALPDNYQGVYMFRIIGGESGFKEALELYTNKPYAGRMAEAVMYNAQSPNDAIKATSRDSTGILYHTSFVHEGSWFMWNGIGASDRQTDWFNYQRKEWHSEVTLKQPAGVVLYPAHGKWQQVTK